MLKGFIDLIAPFGINERLVRTSVFRLAREGWLRATPFGRRSLYRLTKDGARRFELAYRRIYAPPDDRWDDTWELVIADRSSVRVDLDHVARAVGGPPKGFPNVTSEQRMRPQAIVVVARDHGVE